MTPEYAFWHAKHIDKCPREDTREVVCKSPKVAYWYARNIDKYAREDTWLAVKNTKYEEEYRKLFNKLMKEEII